MFNLILNKNDYISALSGVQEILTFRFSMEDNVLEIW